MIDELNKELFELGKKYKEAGLRLISKVQKLEPDKIFAIETSARINYKYVTEGCGWTFEDEDGLLELSSELSDAIKEHKPDKIVIDGLYDGDVVFKLDDKVEIDCDIWLFKHCLFEEQMKYVFNKSGNSYKLNLKESNIEYGDDEYTIQFCDAHIKLVSEYSEYYRTEEFIQS